MSAVRWGILSTARINRLVLAGAKASETAEVIAVASRDSAHAEARAIEALYRSAEASAPVRVADWSSV